MQSLSMYILPVLLTIAATSDVMSFRIPNWLTILTAALFFPVAWVSGMAPHEFGMHLLAGVGLFVLGFILFQSGTFGGGDAKLMAAAGLWFGTAKLIPFLFFTTLAGGVLALAVSLWSVIMIQWEVQVDKTILESFGQKFRKLNLDLPYAVAFAVGGIMALKDSAWFIT